MGSRCQLSSRPGYTWMHRSWNSQALSQMCLQSQTSFRGLSAPYCF